MGIALIFTLSKNAFMPFLQTECTTTGEVTICEYIQVAPFMVVDMPLVLGVSLIIAIMAAQFVRYVFYR